MKKFTVIGEKLLKLIFFLEFLEQEESASLRLSFCLEFYARVLVLSM